MNAGEIWYANFPFEEDSSKSTHRPCIILDVEKLEVLSIKVTKHDPRDDSDIPITKWKESNLKFPSCARVSKAIVITKDAFDKKIGDTDDIDFNNIINKYIELNS